MKVLDRVLYGDDIAGPIFIYIVDKGSQGGRLSTPGGAGNQDQPAFFQADLFQYRRQVETVQRRNTLMDMARKTIVTVPRWE